MAISFGRYQLLRKIASGGMGQVLLARKGDEGFEKLVVLKRILPHLVEDEEFFTMFKDEAKIAMRLDHPNIVRINEFGVENNVHFIEMEYVAGEDVRRISKRATATGTTIPLGIIIRIVADAAAGLDFAHKATDGKGVPLEIVHRDVSPQNVLLGFDGSVKLIDFGVAKAAGRSQNTATGVLKGKFPYMSPEQAEGEHLDARSDVFALGIILWELLTGKRLFKGENDLATQRLVRACQVPPPSTVGSNVDPQFDKIVLKALARNRENRFAELENYAVKNSIASSSGHLANFLTQLCAEQIAREADPRRFEEDSGLTDLDAGGLPKPSGNATVVERVIPQGGHTQALKPPKNSNRFVLLAALLGVPLLAIVGFFALGNPPVVSTVVDAGTIQAVVIAPEIKVEPIDAAVEIQSATIRLETKPSGAAVEIRGENQGLTPFEQTVFTDTFPVKAKVSLEGFDSVVVEFSAAQLEHSIVLKKKTVKKVDPGIKTER
jgi:serine/threonine protein kinase